MKVIWEACILPTKFMQINRLCLLSFTHNCCQFTNNCCHYTNVVILRLCVREILNDLKWKRTDKCGWWVSVEMDKVPGVLKQSVLYGNGKARPF